MAKHSIITYTGDGATIQYAINFTGGYTAEADVFCQVNNEVDGLLNPVYRTLTFVSEGLVDIGGAVPGVGEPIVFTRATPISTAVNDFEDGVGLTGPALDAGFQQVIFGIQEAQDNLQDAEDTEAALASAEAARDAALAAQAAAELAETNAETAETNAAASAASIVGDAAAAAVSAATAAAAQVAAAISETNAGTSETNAAASEASATTDAANAAADAASAAASETNAAASAAEAASYSAALPEVNDDTFRIRDSVDTTKKVAFEVSGVSAGTTRTITIPDADITLGEGGAGGLVAVFISSATGDELTSSLSVNADTSSNAIVRDLPAAPEDGDMLEVYDAANTFGLNSLTLGRNGKTIDGEASDMVFSTRGLGGRLSYDGTAGGWKFTPIWSTADLITDDFQVRTEVTATAGQTVFSGLNYTVGLIQVFLNGTLLDGSDYTATDGSQVILTDGADLDDEVTFIAFKARPVRSFGEVSETVSPDLSGVRDLGTQDRRWKALHVDAINGGGLSGFKNRLQNPLFQVDEEGNAAGVTTVHAHAVEGWAPQFSNGVTTQTLSRQGGDSVPYKLRYEVTTGSDAAIASGDYAVIRTAIEGYDIADALWGTANAKPVWISGRVNAPTTGTYCVVVRNGVADRSYVFEIECVAGTWVDFEHMVPGDVTGTWEKTTSRSMIVTFVVAAGTDFHAAADEWHGADHFCTVNQANGLETNGNHYEIEDIRVSVGGPITTEWRPIGMDELHCMRYFEKSSGTFYGGGSSSGTTYYTHRWIVRKRVEPTFGYGVLYGSIHSSKVDGVTISRATSPGAVNYPQANARLI